MIKAIIFDADGVLLDNTMFYLKCYKETARRLGMEVPSDSKVKKAFGLPWEGMLMKIYGKATEDMKKNYIEIVRSRECEIKTMDGLEYVLERLKFRKAIVTSKSKIGLERQIGNLLRYFEVIVSLDDTEKHKPDPEPLLLACKKLGLKPEETVYVGDSIIDFEAAKNAGIDFIGFISGSTTKKEFEALNIKSVISLKELLREFQ